MGLRSLCIEISIKKYLNFLIYHLNQFMSFFMCKLLKLISKKKKRNALLAHASLKITQTATVKQKNVQFKNI